MALGLHPTRRHHRVGHEVVAAMPEEVTTAGRDVHEQVLEQLGLVRRDAEIDDRAPLDGRQIFRAEDRDVDGVAQWLVLRSISRKSTRLTAVSIAISTSSRSPPRIWFGRFADW